MTHRYEKFYFILFFLLATFIEMIDRYLFDTSASYMIFEMLAFLIIGILLGLDKVETSSIKFNKNRFIFVVFPLIIFLFYYFFMVLRLYFIDISIIVPYYLSYIVYNSELYGEIASLLLGYMTVTSLYKINTE